MLRGISKIITGDLLKILCDMGHGDEIVIADANFPADTMAQRLVRLPGIDACTVLEEVCRLLPIDTAYSDVAAFTLDITDSDKAKGVTAPDMWKKGIDIMTEAYGEPIELGKIERFAFYERAKKAYCVIQTGEERPYGNFLLVKGIIV